MFDTPSSGRSSLSCLRPWGDVAIYDIKWKITAMDLVATFVHPDVSSRTGTILIRPVARGIVMRARSILLFAERYNGFSLPGGGVADDEDPIQGLCRKMKEETGSRNVQVLSLDKTTEELRPRWQPGFDLLHMTVHYFSAKSTKYCVPPA